MSIINEIGDIEIKNEEDKRIMEIIEKKEYEKLTEEDKLKIKKKCTGCEKFKALKEYDISKSGKFGHHPKCKECTKIISHKYYLKKANKNKELKIIIE